jgi:DNA primase
MTQMKDSATDWAAGQFQECLLSDEGKAARDRLGELGISEESISRFQIGYAPDSGSWLLDRAVDVISPGALAYSGLIVEGAAGRSDRFVDCLTFPICDQWGVLGGFAALSLSSDCRWSLSRPNLRFRPERLLYGLHLAKEAILRSRVAVVVGSPLECIQLHRAGATNAVATVGELIDEQVNALYRLANEITVIVPSPQTEADARRHRGLLNAGIDVHILRDGIESLASSAAPVRLAS